MLPGCHSCGLRSPSGGEGLQQVGDQGDQLPFATDIQPFARAELQEALTNLNQAIGNKPDYDDAMAYLNLAYRRKADVDWGNEYAREDDLAKANEWVARSMETRKAREKKRQGTDSEQR